MIYSLDDALQIAVSDLSPDLISSEMLIKIRRLAGMLVPLFWCGFECRLDRKISNVDFHQGVMLNNTNADMLSTHISALQLSENSAWRRIKKFCTRWVKPSSSLGKYIDKIGFEFDVLESFSNTPFPSVFIALKYGSRYSNVKLYAAAEEVMHILGVQPLLSESQEHFHRCFHLDSHGAYVTHVGTMLSRPKTVLRVNIAGVSPTQAETVLNWIGWQGSWGEVKPLLQKLAGFTDYLVFGLDMGEICYPHLGVECFLERSSEAKFRLADFLDYLVTIGLCTRAKCDAILAWPGHISPVGTRVPWPSTLIIESMGRPENIFSIFLKEVSHIKITFRPNLPPIAKAYLGFRHCWRTSKKAGPSETLKREEIQ